MKALPICSLQTLMSLASKSRDLFKEEHKDQAKLQEDHKAKARVEKQEIATKKLLEVEKPLSVFYILRIKTKEELEAALGEHKHNEQRKRILSKQLKIYVNGYGLRQYDISLAKGGKFQYAVIKTKLEEMMDAINASPPRLALA